ncbi:MAG TPA: hypothetical protein VFU31_19675 [Candidatus Binatia bacterium]|nr:hypothetical protein [Candidatus Binatia bacterium]
MTKPAFDMGSEMKACKNPIISAIQLVEGFNVQVVQCQEILNSEGIVEDLEAALEQFREIASGK